MENLPEYIEGIPTNKHQVKERFELVMSYYEKLWIKLQRDSRSNYIHNEFLDAQIFIVKNESDKKTAREARPIEGLSVFSAVKGGAQKKNGYKLIITLYHTFVRKDIPYLNFTAKLTIGVLTNMKHIQYSVNKIEILKQKT